MPMKISRSLTRRLLLAVFAVLLAGAAVFVALRAGPLAPVRVTVVRATQGNLAPSLFGIGTVEARRAYLVGPTIAGRVRRVLVDVGDTVRAGQLLAEMDPVDLDERMTASEASIARGTAAVDAAQALLADARAREELATVNLRRYVDLGTKNFVAPSAVEARVQEQASAQAAVRAADANLVAARRDGQRLGAERAAVHQQRESMKLLAPTNGLVTSREAEPGSTVIAGQAVLRLVDPATMWVKTRIDQSRAGGLATQLSARVVLRSMPATPLAGRVVRIETVSDSVTEERIALVAFDTQHAGVSIGELAEVSVALPTVANAVLLPDASLRRVDGKTGVWRVDNDTPRFVPVRTGATSLDGQVQVLEGVAKGDQVVLYSERELGARTRLKVVDSLDGASR